MARSSLKKSAQGSERKVKQSVDALERRLQYINEIITCWKEKFRTRCGPPYNTMAMPSASAIAKALSLDKDIDICERTVRNTIAAINRKKGGGIFEYDPLGHGYKPGSSELVMFPDLDNKDLQDIYTMLRLQPSLIPGISPDLASKVKAIGRQQHPPAEPANQRLATETPILKNPSGELALSWMSQKEFIKNFQMVKEAGRKCQQLSVEYTSRKGETRRRTIDPHGMFLDHEAWYVRAYCHEKKAMRSFNILRIRSPQLLDASFVPNPQVAREIADGKCYDYPVFNDVVLRIAPGLATMVREHTWFCHEAGGETFQDGLPGGWVEMRIKWGYAPHVVSWVLRQGGDAVAVEPPDLRNEVLTASRKLLEIHQKPGR